MSARSNPQRWAPIPPSFQASDMPIIHSRSFTGSRRVIKEDSFSRNSSKKDSQISIQGSGGSFSRASGSQASIRSSESARSSENSRLKCHCEANLFLEKYRKDLEILFQSKYKAPSTEKSLEDDDDFDPKFPALYTSRRVSFFNDDDDFLDAVRGTDRSLPRIASSRSSTRKRSRSKLSLRQSKVSEGFKNLKRTTTDRLRKERLLREKKYQLDKNKRIMEKQLRYADEGDVNAVEIQQNLQEIERAYKELQESEKELEEFKRQEEETRQDLIQKETLIKQKLESAKEAEESVILPEEPKPDIRPFTREQKSRQSRFKPLQRDSKSSKSRMRFLPSISKSARATRQFGDKEFLQEDLFDYYPCYSEEEIEEEEDAEPQEVDYSKYFRKYPFYDHEPEVPQEEESGYPSEYEYQYSAYFGEEEPDLSSPMKQAQYYLKQRRVDEFFKFLGAHLTAGQPENPIEFLLNLLDQCLDYRENYCDPPLLFQLKHIESLYKSLDPMGFGEISLDQYNIGLLTLGLKTKNGNHVPKLNAQLKVSKDDFITDAYRMLKKQLNRMIFVPGELKTQLASLEKATWNSRTSLTRSG